MRVPWIGAGASIPAEYPSALALLGRLEEAATAASSLGCVAACRMGAEPGRDALDLH